MIASSPKLDFSNLPLVEAVVRIHFQTRIKIDFQLVSDVHQLLHGDFPQVNPASTIEVHPSLAESGFSIGPGELPGADYTGHQLGLSLQLQPQLLAVRWSRGVSEHSPDYPRFTRLREVLGEAYSHLRAALRSDFPSPAITNMRYLNFIRVADPRPYLAPEYLPVAVGPAESVQEQIVAWREPRGIDLRYEVKSGELRRGKAKSDGFVLATVGGRLLESDSDPIKSLQEVHDRLQILFADLISEKAKEEWGLATNTSSQAR